MPEQGEIRNVIQKTLQETTEGLYYTHVRINNNTAKILEASSFLYALVEILNEKGLISIEELDARQAKLADRIINKFVKSGIGLLYQDVEEDKYSFVTYMSSAPFPAGGLIATTMKNGGSGKDFPHF